MFRRSLPDLRRGAAFIFGLIPHSARRLQNLGQLLALTLMLLPTMASANLGAATDAVTDDNEVDVSVADTELVASDSPAGQSIVIENIEEDAVGETPMDPVAVSAEELISTGDVWERLRNGFRLDLEIDNPYIEVHRQWFIEHQPYIDRMTARAARYLFHTVAEAEKRGLPTELALLPIIESAYDPFAYSPASASGMWQFIPGTGRMFGLRQDWWYDGRRDVVESTRAAYSFLQELSNKFNGDWQLALAAYNAGPGAVQRAIDRNVAEGKPTDFWSLNLPAETRAYVPRFWAIAQLVRAPQRYGVQFPAVVNKPFFREVALNSQIDLAAAAKLAGLPLRELYQLNPGFSRWATSPAGPHRLLIPTSVSEDFEQLVQELPPPQRVVVQRYRVKRGDTLARIAKRFDLTQAELKRLNKLRGNKLPVGRQLVVARASRAPQDYELSQDQRTARLQSLSVRDKDRLKYRTKKGDTLWSVARKHGVSPRALARWNGLGSRDHLQPGRQLVIHRDKNDESTADIVVAKRSTQRSEKRVAAKTKGDKQRIRYEVKKGDTLFSISRRYDVSVKDIQRWNSTHNSIKPGQDLVIYVASNES